MADILLIQPPIRDFYLTAKRTVPLGLASIAAALIQRGYAVELLDALATRRSRRLQPPASLQRAAELYGDADRAPFALFHGVKHFGLSFGAVGQAARRSGARLVGISSLFSAYSDEALRVAQAVREALPRCTIVLGGHHPTTLPHRVLTHPAVDLVIRGEGEAAMCDLADALLRQRGTLEQIPGLVRGNASTIATPAVAPDLDQLLRPAMDLVDAEHYRRGGRGSGVVMASRGCPLRCSYCAVCAHGEIPYRRRSVQSVLDEIRGHVARGATFIDFEDENLSLDRRWFASLLQGLQREHGGRLELRAMNGLLPQTLTPTLVQAMAAAGFHTLNLALVTADPEQSVRFRRPDQRAAFDAALAAAAQHGLSAVGYIIVGAPGQTPASSARDLLYLAARRVLAGVSVFYAAPGSEDYQRCAVTGQLPIQLAQLRSTALAVEDPLSAVTLLRLGRVVNFAKAQLDLGREVPAPAALDPGWSAAPHADRNALGRQLLAAFLHDGTLWGVSADGQPFSHRVNTELCRLVATRLQQTPLRGTGTAPR